ncbi:L-threonylcarbamoyladenylate synthase [Anaeromicropila populeti]|uniref:L-threonylcarbamoyladenylate synthase n=1 Tax=Anaeromicropila populeti TaxID=37658 RepID=A0A1I6HSH6_9FIRM|nr:L-threonylcarbamoyladenylate synthase [Anaeromicropila populeti]SFR57385.1 tRNA threonylcarbamoyl adenosine modification protein, Sua5/YciO/YrdC/YwlC family [Anaeromicropila populeti]
MLELNNILDASQKSLEIAATCVKSGGVIIAPSDTNVALTINPWIEESIDRIFKIKGRPATSPLTLFVLEPDEWKEYAESEDAETVDLLTKAFWPGPLNIILKKKETVSNRMVCGGDTVSIGCLSNTLWRNFMKTLEMPVAMTSANLSGQADGILVDFDLACEQVGDKVDYLLPGEDINTTASSTIISLVGEPVILRLGDITKEEIEAVIKKEVRLKA